jgi:hypothetical protein
MIKNFGSILKKFDTNEIVAKKTTFLICTRLGSFQRSCLQLIQKGMKNIPSAIAFTLFCVFPTFDTFFNELNNQFTNKSDLVRLMTFELFQFHQFVVFFEQDTPNLLIHLQFWIKINTNAFQQALQSILIQYCQKQNSHLEQVLKRILDLKNKEINEMIEKNIIDSLCYVLSKERIAWIHLMVEFIPLERYSTILMNSILMEDGNVTVRETILKIFETHATNEFIAQNVKKLQKITKFDPSPKIRLATLKLIINNSKSIADHVVLLLVKCLDIDLSIREFSYKQICDLSRIDFVSSDGTYPTTLRTVILEGLKSSSNQIKEYTNQILETMLLDDCENGLEFLNVNQNYALLEPFLIENLNKFDV